MSDLIFWSYYFLGVLGWLELVRRQVDRERLSKWGSDMALKRWEKGKKVEWVKGPDRT